MSNLSIQQQLAERRARLAENQNRQPNEAPPSEPSQSSQPSQPSQSSQPDQPSQAVNDVIINNHPNVNSNNDGGNGGGVLDQHQLDHEIALQLQRQFDQEESQQQPPSNNNHNHNHNNNQIPSMFGGHQFFPSNNNGGGPNQSSSSSSYSYSYTSPSGNVHSMQSNQAPDTNLMNQFMSHQQPRPQNNNHNANANPFNQPFFQQAAFRSNNNNNNNAAAAHPFNNPMFQEMMNGMNNDNIQPMNMNFMINNLFQNGQNGNLDDLMHMIRPNMPRGVQQQNIDNLTTTDSYKPKQKQNIDNTNNNNNNTEMEQKDDKNKKKKEEDTEIEKCSICLEEFKDGETIRRLPCLHIFHKDEIDHWLKKNSKCPICRIPIEQQ